jgi:cysteine desulfurase
VAAAEADLGGQGRGAGQHLDLDVEGRALGRRWPQAHLAVAERAVAATDGVEHLDVLPVHPDPPRGGGRDAARQRTLAPHVDPGEPKVRPAVPHLEREQHQPVAGDRPEVEGQRLDAPERRRHRHLGRQVGRHGGSRFGGRAGRYRRGVPLDLDHAATTPPRPAARAAFDAWVAAANASATHAGGQHARAAVEEARERIAGVLRCSPHEVVFTAGGTEADNLAVKGVVWAARDRRPDRTPHVVVTAVEHAAVLEPARWLADRGDARLTVVPPDPDGTVPVERVLEATADDTVLVSVMVANNELGAVNHLAAIGDALAARPAALHTDAVQALATLDVDVDAWRLDALALSGHKLGAPQGVGAAVLRRGLGVEPLLHGGGQDRGVRSGTFAVGLVAALGAAVTQAADERTALRDRLRRLSDRLVDGLLTIDGVHRNGPTDPRRRLASHVHLGLDDVDPTALALALDRAGVRASGGSACGAGAAKPSHVVEACGLTGTPLRLSLGWTTTDDDIDRALDVLTALVPELRAGVPVLRPLGGA